MNYPLGAVRQLAERRSSNLRVCRFDSDPRYSKRVGWALACPSGCNPPAFGHCRFNSCPAHQQLSTAARAAAVRKAVATDNKRPVRLSAQDASQQGRSPTDEGG